MAKHLPLIADMNELLALFHKSTNLQAFLQEMVELVARHISTQVASIYFLDDEQLVLKANHGLNEKAVDVLHISINEGLVGKAMLDLCPVLDNQASKNPHFKLIDGLDSQLYDSFLAVPIARGLKRIGVLVVQRDITHPFDEYDTLALSAITSQLAMLIEQTHLLMSAGLPVKKTKRCSEIISRKVDVKTASRGRAYGKLSHGRKQLWPPSLPKTLPEFGLEDFKIAMGLTVSQLERLQKRVEETLSDVASLIFTSHLLMLKDPAFGGRMIDEIHANVHPAQAICKVVNEYRGIFAKSPNPAMQEKVQDISDLGARLINNLLDEPMAELNANHGIVVARDLAPSDILTLSAEGVEGLVLIGGGVTSHVAILARSLHIPLVIADENSLLDLPNGAELLIDNGVLLIKPDMQAIAEYHQRVKNDGLNDDKIKCVGPLFTSDAVSVKLDINVNLVTDVEYAKDYHPDGIGLYRTEFPFMLRSALPTEEEQYQIFSQVAQGVGKNPLTIRTLDVGGDKMMAYYESPKEENPFLGLRSIRFALKHRELFRHHLRAILRASVGKDLKIMFPVISSIEEIRVAKRAVVEAIGSLVAEGAPCNSKPKLGIMIEVPSVLALIDEIAAEVDFFCLGTNDFVQYLLCVDRTNEMVADFYCSHHPAVVRALNIVVRAADKAGIELSVCGDMAHNGAYIPLLIGLGVRRLSVDGAYLSSTRKIVESINCAKVKVMAQKALECTVIDEIADLLNIEERYHIACKHI